MDAPNGKPLIVTESIRRSQEQRNSLWEGMLRGVEQRLSKTTVSDAQNIRCGWKTCAPTEKSAKVNIAATVTSASFATVSTSSASSTTPWSTSSPKSPSFELTEPVIIAEKVKKNNGVRADLFEARLKLAEKGMGRDTKDESSTSWPPKPVMPKLRDIEDDVFESESESEEEDDVKRTVQVCRRANAGL